MSLSLALAPFEWRGPQDQPARHARLRRLHRRGRRPRWRRRPGRVRVSAVDGVEVQTEALWRLAARARACPRMVFVNKLDRERADFDRTLDQLRDRFGAGLRAPRAADRARRPSSTASSTCCTDTAYLVRRRPTDRTTAPIPADAGRRRAQCARRARRGDRRRPTTSCWSATSTARCRRSTSSSTRWPDEVAHGRRCSRSCAARPLTGVGVDRLADFICEIGPSPADRPPSRSRPATPRSRSPPTPAGRAAGLRVQDHRRPLRRPASRCSRCCRARSTPTTTSSTRGRRRRAPPRPVPRCGARSRTPVDGVAAGDIVAVAKLADTGDRRHAGARRARRCVVAADRRRRAVLADRHRGPHPGRRRQAGRAAAPAAGRGPGARRRAATTRRTRRCCGASARPTWQVAARAARSASSASTSTPRTCGSPTARRSPAAAEAEGKHKKQIGRARPVRRVPPARRAARAGRGLRVRRQDRRRRHPPPVHPGRGEGRRGGHGGRAACYGYPVVDVGSSCYRRQVPLRRLVRDGFRIAGAARRSRRRWPRPAPVLLEPISPARGHRARRPPGRRDGRPQRPPRPGAGHRRPATAST